MSVLVRSINHHAHRVYLVTIDNVAVQYNDGGFLPYVVLLTICVKHWEIRPTPLSVLIITTNVLPKRFDIISP